MKLSTRIWISDFFSEFLNAEKYQKNEFNFLNTTDRDDVKWNVVTKNWECGKTSHLPILSQQFLMDVSSSAKLRRQFVEMAANQNTLTSNGCSFRLSNLLASSFFYIVVNFFMFIQTTVFVTASAPLYPFSRTHACFLTFTAIVLSMLQYWIANVKKMSNCLFGMNCWCFSFSMSDLLLLCSITINGGFF